MLIGRRGNFLLKQPFNKYAANGLQGRIVAVAFIKHMVSRGVNIENLVYVPVEFTSQYPTDLAANVIIVTIEAHDGRKYNIPDIYIENLYDDNVIFVDAYLTVCLRELPLNTDFKFIRQQVAKEASRFSGVTVVDHDVSISISDKSTVQTFDEAKITNATRHDKIKNLKSDYGRYVKEIAKSSSLGKKVKSLQHKLKHLLG